MRYNPETNEIDIGIVGAVIIAVCAVVGFMVLITLAVEFVMWIATFAWP